MKFSYFRKPIGKYYGIDATTIVLLILWWLLNAIIPTKGIWRGVGFIVVNGTLLINILRSVSTDTQKRSAENRAVCAFLEQASAKIKTWSTPKPPKAQAQPGVIYKQFKCPSCGQKMRAPKGRGKIRVTCHSCGNIFEKKV